MTTDDAGDRHADNADNIGEKVCTVLTAKFFFFFFFFQTRFESIDQFGFFFSLFFLLIHENTKRNLCELIGHHPKGIVSSHHPKKWKKINSKY